MALNDDDMEAMVMLLRDKTHLVRFNASEVEAVLRFMESQGADLKPAPHGFELPDLRGRVSAFADAIIEPEAAPTVE
jgi:hypothetical protein